MSLRIVIITTVVIFSHLIGVSSAFFFSRPDNWDDLRVSWGINPFNGYNFDSLPRTTDNAEGEGWFEFSKCDNSPGATVRGRVYVKDDFAVMLLFDKNGYIAGLQTRVSETTTTTTSNHVYPGKYLVPPFVKKGGGYYMTTYFTNPESICTVGRTHRDFEIDGTGSDLYIQVGPRPDTDVMKIPRQESMLAADPSAGRGGKVDGGSGGGGSGEGGGGGAKWEEGKCFYTMGKHYWYNVTDDMDCDGIFPIFLLYNRGELNAFGWVFPLELVGPRYEYPRTIYFRLFMKSVPRCLVTRGTITTMHVFLTSRPRSNLC